MVDDFRDCLEQRLIELGIEPIVGDISKFVENRLLFYSNELNQLFENNGYVASYVYYLFYDEPLTPAPTRNKDLMKLFPFQFTLMHMLKFLREAMLSVFS